jgi:hypothetical protein
MLKVPFLKKKYHIFFKLGSVVADIINFRLVQLTTFLSVPFAPCR